jgi:sarcosine oxidase
VKKTADVIVVGLGVDGASAAYQIAKRGADVIGIEQHWPAHDRGSSHGESRITRFACGEGSIYAPLSFRSRRVWEDLEELFNIRRELYRPTGGLMIGLNEKNGTFHGKKDFVGDSVKWAKRYNVRHRIHSWNDIRSVFPLIHARMDEYGYFEPDAGVLFPEKCVRALHLASQAAGAKLYFGTRVMDIREEEGRVIVTTDEGEFSAAKCIIAAGAFVKCFVPEIHRKIFKIVRQIMFWYKPKRHPKRFIADRFPVFIWERLGFYGIPDLGNGLVKVALGERFVETDPAHVNRDVSEEEYQEMEQVLRMSIPDLLGQRVKAATCMYTQTPDKDFVIDHHPDMENVLIVSACSGHGFKHAPAVGDIAARIVLGEDGEFNLEKFSFDRFKEIQ